MCKISSKIEVFEQFFGILREKVDYYYKEKQQKLIKEFISENFVNKKDQYEQI